MGSERKAQQIVLAVDDDPGSLGAVTETLEAAGLMALSARDGNSALGLLDRITPDLVLLDAIMPGLDGFETCRRIKAMPGFSLTPVVFLTGLDASDDVLNGLRAGGVDYVVKPIDQQVLLERIRIHIANADHVKEARAALDVTGPGVFALAHGSEISWASDAAQASLELHGSPQFWTLSEAVQAWAQGQSDKAISQSSPLRTEPCDGTVLKFALIGRMANGDMLIRVETFDDISDSERLTRTLNLSPREGEVLAWIAQGKSNRDIGEILDLSTRTITKHIEQIFQKLGVENRTAAALTAMKVLKS